MNRTYIIFGSIGVLVLIAFLMLLGIIPGLRPDTPDAVTLEMWGADEPREFWNGIFSLYTAIAPHATINYVQKDPATYETELLNALAAGAGPDIFLLRDMWLDEHRDKTLPLPEGNPEYTRADLKMIFADSVVDAITTPEHSLIGVPLALDTLALFYNRDYLNSANIPLPARTWEELAEQSRQLTRYTEIGGIVRSGVALGTADNVDHAADILSLLMLQSGGAVVDFQKNDSAINSPQTRSALDFYTSFAAPSKNTYSWNAFFDSALQAFSRGETVMMIGYASDVKNIVARNPQLNFDIAPAPQIRLGDARVNFGRFSVFSVSRASANTREAWQFLLWLTGRGPQKQYADLQGLPPVRRDLVTTVPPREYLVPFYQQVLTARVHAPIIGYSIIGILGDMIEEITSRQLSMNQAITRAEFKIREALRNR